MPNKRKATKKSKFLGRRHFGVGNCKNRRGSGNRGGRGNAGMCKHKNSWATVYAPGYFGKHGFVRQCTVKLPVAHLYEIDRKALLGKLEKKGGKFAFSFEGKVLSTGEVTQPLSVSAFAWSKAVEEKLKAKGGEILKLERPKTGKVSKSGVKAKPAATPKAA
ncbi:MAG: uL15 family ribosomal protein [Candidatus Micrarchaeia archaeon]